MSKKSADPRKGRNTLDGKYVLRGAVGWCLLGLMGICCAVIAFLPDRWHLAQVVAAMLQMFCTGVVAALYLPIWQAVESDANEATSEIRLPPSLE